MFSKSKQISILIGMLYEEHKKRLSARQRVKQLEELLAESERRNDEYSLQNRALRRELERTVNEDELKKLLAENERLSAENASQRRWNKALLKINDSLDEVNRTMAKKLTEEMLLPLRTENEAYKAANQKLRENLAALKAEKQQKKDG